MCAVRRAVFCLGLILTVSMFAAGEPAREKVIFDTDIGGDVDDSYALAYLLAEPQCDLLGVTTVWGFPEQRAEMASAICTAFGRPDLPIHPGRGRPLLHPRPPVPPAQLKALGDWPRKKFADDRSAVAFMRKVIRDNPHEVTLIAVGPLMNVADLFLTDPEIPSLLKRLVLMGGRYAEGAPQPEWNCACDPEATAVVLGPGAIEKIPAAYLFGLDATEKTAKHPNDLIALCRTLPALASIRSATEDFFRRHNYYFKMTKAMHDPLTCMSIFHPEICTYRRGRVQLISNGVKMMTGFKIDEKGPHHAAATVDVAAFYRIYQDTLKAKELKTGSRE